MKLYTKYQARPSESLISEAADCFAIHPIFWEEVSEGIGNVVLLLTDTDNEKYYLKLYNSQHPVHNVQAETFFTSQIHPQAIPVPEYRIIPTKNATPVYFRLGNN
jgi:hypothetical protein